jgi:hypothetical protein
MAVTDAIEVVFFGDIDCARTVDFQPPDFPDASGKPVNVDEIITRDELSIGERFSGQTVEQSGNFDSITGVATGPLQVLAGAVNQNLAVRDDLIDGQTLVGISAASEGFPNESALGEGAIALHFSVDQSELGLEFQGLSDAGATVSVTFFTRDALLLETIGFTNSGSYGFKRIGGVEDIAGVLITNTDAEGIAIDNVCWGSVFVPPCDAVVRLEGCSEGAFILPAQAPPIPPVTRGGDSVKVDIVFEDVGGLCNLEEFRAWGLEVQFDDDRLDFAGCRPGQFIDDFFIFSCQQVIGQPRIKVQAIVGAGGPIDPGNDPVLFATLCFIPSEGSNQTLDSYEFSTLNFTDDFGTEIQFLELDIQPDTLTVLTELHGTGDITLNGELTGGDAQCIHETALFFDVVHDGSFPDCVISTPPPPNECNTAPIERYKADTNCDGFVTSLDADVVFDASACGDGVVPPEPCLAKNFEGCPPPEARQRVYAPYIATRSDGRVRLGEVKGSGTDVIRVPLEVQGSGPLRAFTLDFSHPTTLEVVDVEPSAETSAWRWFGHGQPAPGSLRVVGAVGTYPAVDLAENEWTTLAYIVVRAATEEASAGRFELVASWDDVEGVPLLGGGISISGASAVDLPAEFALGTGRPNPSGGTVEIEFLVPAGSTSHVDIAIYNVQGQLVRSLVDGPQVPGRHTVSWDGKDRSGRSVAAGTYFSRMNAGSFQQTRKIVQRR